MAKIVPFLAQHLTQLQVQSAQSASIDWAAPGHAQSLESLPSYSLVDDDGKVWACAGIMDVWAGRSMCWAALGADAGQRLVQLHRAVERALDLHDYRRIECDVAQGFAAGHRWAKMLGFRAEIENMPAYFPDGSAATRYVRFK